MHVCCTSSSVRSELGCMDSTRTYQDLLQGGRKDTAATHEFCVFDVELEGQTELTPCPFFSVQGKKERPTSAEFSICDTAQVQRIASTACRRQ